jgi:hypothetical protein
MNAPDHIGCCGINCDTCKAFLATQADDDALRADVAEEWTHAYNTPIEPHDINCTGCRRVGIKFHFTEFQCEVRQCVHQRHLDTCAACTEYPCPKVDAIQKHAPQARQQLDALRNAADLDDPTPDR